MPQDSDQGHHQRDEYLKGYVVGHDYHPYGSQHGERCEFQDLVEHYADGAFSCALGGPLLDVPYPDEVAYPAGRDDAVERADEIYPEQGPVP